MRFAVKLESESEAMELAPIAETGIILSRIIHRLEEGYLGGSCLDSNGNTVGEWKLEGDG